MQPEETILKGGSLATTSIIDNGGKKFVRKKISLVKEREYGYYRWYSQLKKMQRLGRMFPDLFVKVIDFGYKVDREHFRPHHQYAYMDLEYHEEATNCYDYLKGYYRSEDEGKRLAHTILQAVHPLYEHQIPSFKGAMSLYFEEEIISKINACMQDPRFRKDYVQTQIPQLLTRLKTMAIETYQTPTESLTHGNLTLENILYLPREDKVLLIDVYEENVIDNKYNDYSQLAQSANSHYELMLEHGKDFEVPRAIRAFNNELKKIWRHDLYSWEINLIKFFECSQFYRMLPFKLKAGVDPLPYLRVAERLTKECLRAV